MVAIAAVITVVMLTLTAWGHRHTSNGPAGAESTPGRTTSSPAPSGSRAPARARQPTRPASSAATAASSRPSRTVSAPSATATPRLTVQQLSANLSSLLGAGDSFSVAGFDLTTGRTVTAGATSGMTEASVVKLDILETALYRQQTGQSSFDDDDVADMMEHSDNAAADRVFDDDGGNSGLQQYNDKVGLGQHPAGPHRHLGALDHRGQPTSSPC